MCVYMMHTANKIRWFMKETAQIPCRKCTLLWCFGIDSSLIFIFPLHPEYTNFRQICIFLSSCPWERTSTRPWIPVMGTMWKTGGEIPASIVGGSFLWVWTWVSHVGCEMLWSAVAPPAQLLYIFLCVGVFRCHLSDGILEERWGAV